MPKHCMLSDWNTWFTTVKLKKFILQEISNVSLQGHSLRISHLTIRSAPWPTDIHQVCRIPPSPPTGERLKSPDVHRWLVDLDILAQATEHTAQLLSHLLAVGFRINCAIKLAFTDSAEHRWIVSGLCNLLVEERATAFCVSPGNIGHILDVCLRCLWLMASIVVVIHRCGTP